ncbi:hypothetical protein [Polyangium sp. y55x31]|uniref:hypothetical protein n=1 Tax=Polyangium sp. y55x31 TaxID=3042688 RepID=UPI002482C075|nr:hypothetical protein [Polyangium sp. y55x31]MDI1479296.1 hypothetical protein [Polyangium sp. y55x31]
MSSLDGASDGAQEFHGDPLRQRIADLERQIAEQQRTIDALRQASAWKLLGAQVVLTGIRPEVARALVDLDLGLDGLVVRGTLQSGIAFAMGRG